jgi:hypothetical protein
MLAGTTPLHKELEDILHRLQIMKLQLHSVHVMLRTMACSQHY